MAQTIRLQHASGLALSLSTLSAAWLACSVPLAGGGRRSVILQRTEPPSEGMRSAFLGATIGRYANRIGNARITMPGAGGRSWALQPDAGSRHQLHGGPQGFHAREWTVDSADATQARLSIVSPDGDQGYPGTLHAQVTYRLAGAMVVEMEAVATVTHPSPVCLTNHAYFNLDGRPGDVRQHRLQIAASRYLPVDAELIPLGGLEDVQGTGFDFRQATPIGARWLCDAQQQQAAGYDHAFVLDAACAGMAAPAAVLTSTDGALQLQMATTLPAIQFYGGQLLRGVAAPGGGDVPACGAVALEPQFLPDSPNHPEWPQPTCWLQPGAHYRHVIRYSFVG